MTEIDTQQSVVVVKMEPLEQKEAVEAGEFGSQRLQAGESAAVKKAGLLAMPKRSSKGNKGFVYRKSNRLKHGVDQDSENVKPYHRSKLRYLLSTLIQQHEWHHACGVLGVLLGIPYSSAYPRAVVGCNSDFAAAMEVLQRVQNVGSNDVRIRRLFRLLNRCQPNQRAKGKVQLELALYLMSVGDREAAYNELRPVVDGKVFREEPMSNFCHGLNSYHLWYEKVIEDTCQVEKKVFNPSNSMEGMGENYEAEFDGLMQSQGGGSLPYVEFGVKSMELDENMWKSSQNTWQSSQSIWQSSQRSIYEETDEEGFVKTGEQFWQSVIVPASPDLDPRLFPIPLIREGGRIREQTKYLVPMRDGRIRDLHAAAVKHLKQALTSAPGMLPALLPLVQLLLAVHDIRGAVDEIDKCSEALKNHYIPPSIKVALLESLDQKDPVQLALCHQDILIRNPLSVPSLRSLITFHSSGHLKTKVLLECICLHLDVEPGSLDIWQKLASCLLELQEQFLISPSTMGYTSLVEGIQAKIREGLTSGPMEEVSRHFLQQLWSGRCKWWFVKHFDDKVGLEWQHDGNLWLMAYKAACVAHIYGPRVWFVEKACTALEGHKQDEASQLVKHHCARSMNLCIE